MKNKIRVLRAERKWSQAELATRVGVSRNSIVSIENGHFDPSLALAFAIAEPALFRMMFSQKPTLSDDDIVTAQGKACFACVVQEVIDYCAINRVQGNAQVIALQLWTLVHGASSLTIDGDYAKVAPQIDIPDMIASGAAQLLFRLPHTRPN